MPLRPSVPQAPGAGPAVAPTERAPRAAVVVLHAGGRAVMLGAIAVTALLALEFDFGVPRAVVALVMGFLGFAAVSAGEGLVVLLWRVLRGLFGSLRAPRAVAALRAVPPVPLGRLLGAFVFVGGDLLWPASFFRHLNLPAVGEIAIVLAGLTSAAVALARMERRSRPARVTLLAVPTVLIVAFAAWVADPGFVGYLDPSPAGSPAGSPAASVTPVDAADRGPFAVRTLSYGGGVSARRPEYGAGADLFTPPVDGSAIFGGHGGAAGAFHRWYWGFGFDALPLNGLVWYPDGAGPFPLVLVVHGNHAMSEPSEPGYAYLGEHLASHGYVVAAIDENFLNGLFFFDGQFAEMPLRAWLILQHLQQWRRWSETPGNPFVDRVDLDRVALIGHSRGGEAVAWAAHLNQWPMEPVQRVSQPGEFGFGIRSVVAIAPSDAHAGPNDRKPDLGDADYLLLAGGHDADTFVLYGVAAYERARSGGGDPGRFQALAYVHQANHGQFNGVWGDSDRGLFNSWLLNRAPLLPGDAQQRAAEALVTSFLSASLGGRAEDRALFRNPPRALDALPTGVVVTRLRDATAIVLQGFDGQDPAPVADAPNARVEALRLRDGETEQGNRALRLGWEAGGRATHEVTVAAADAERWATPAAITFALARVPDAAPATELVLELEASDGATARLTLGQGSALVPSLPAHLVKSRWLYGRNGFPGAIRPEEVVLQTFTVSLAAFEGPPVNPAAVTVIRFLFAAEAAGAVYLDEVALTGD